MKASNCNGTLGLLIVFNLNLLASSDNQSHTKSYLDAQHLLFMIGPSEQSKDEPKIN